MTNLESFEATINPDDPVKNNIIVCRVNNETKEYWLAKATCSPWVTTAADNLEDIPDGTSVVQVGMRAAGGCSSVQHVKLPMHGPARTYQLVHALLFHTRCSHHRFNLQITWYEFKHKDGNNHVYERGDPNGQPMAVSTLLWTGSPVEFSAVRPGTGAKGEYVWSAAMHDKVVKYANWSHGLQE